MSTRKNYLASKSYLIGLILNLPLPLKIIKSKCKKALTMWYQNSNQICVTWIHTLKTSWKCQVRSTHLKRITGEFRNNYKRKWPILISKSINGLMLWRKKLWVILQKCTRTSIWKSTITSTNRCATQKAVLIDLQKVSKINQRRILGNRWKRTCSRSMEDCSQELKLVNNHRKKSTVLRLVNLTNQLDHHLSFQENRTKTRSRRAVKLRKKTKTKTKNLKLQIRQEVPKTRKSLIFRFYNKRWWKILESTRANST